MNTAQAREIPEIRFPGATGTISRLREKFPVYGKVLPEVRFFASSSGFMKKKTSENKSVVQELPYTFFQNSYVGTTPRGYGGLKFQND